MLPSWTGVCGLRGWGPWVHCNWNFQIRKLELCGQTGSILGPLSTRDYDTMLRERGKGRVFLAAYQGKVGDAAQMSLEASALCLAQASHLVLSSPVGHGLGLGKNQMVQTDLGVLPAQLSLGSQLTPLNLFHQL